MTAMYKVDVHHHIIPPTLVIEANSAKLGIKLPRWTISSDKTFSESIGVRTSIFSAPGVSAIADVEESARIARSMNEDCAAIRDKDPQSYGFFATVPSLEHTDVAIREIRYALDTLHADGVMLFTRYGPGDGYLGHAEFVPVWEELNARKAVVLVHPTNNKNEISFNEKLPMPAFDWPHETGRAAMDLILNRRLQQFPDVKIILSHAGGTLPSLVARSTIIAQPEFGAVMSAEDIYAQAKSFYFDLTLSGSAELLPLILGFAKKGHILFGSDYPFATNPVSERFTNFIDAYPMDEETRREIWYGAAKALFPRLKDNNYED